MMSQERVMTLLDGTEVRAGDKVRAIGEAGGLRVCSVLEILRGGVDKALLTAPLPFGTVIRTRYQIKRHKTVKHLVVSFAGGIALTECGVRSTLVTAYPEHATCKKCLKGSKR